MADTAKTSAFKEVTTFADGGECEDTFEFDITECRVETVVVYLDRAEVCRAIKAKLQCGENEVRLKNLSQCIDKDSIRVEGKGSATISEVAYQTKQLTPDEESTQPEREKQLRAKLEEVERKHGVLKTKQHRLSKQREVLDGFADNVKNAGSEGNGDKSSLILDDNVLKGMTGFFDLYDRQALRLDDHLHEMRLQEEKLKAEMSALRTNLQEISTPQEERESRELSVLLDATEPVEVELYVSYVVSKAKWSPKYDIRVFSSENSMKIQYYGMVQQATGENWEDTKLCLSTAMPSVGGIVPDLGTQRLSFKPKFTRSTKRFSSFKKNRYAMPQIMMAMTKSAVNGSISEGDDYDAVMFEESPRDDSITPSLEYTSSEVKESITSTMYEIARRSSIPCDNQGHKVSVAIIDLKPTFEYECVPKRTSHAYLKAKVKNTSPYALLAGPTNIFLDNNFIAKAELKAVSPSEEFTCSLGVDPGLRVTYRPLSKYREQGGVINKVVTTTYKQVVEIKNTHPDAVKMLVMDQLPLSSEEKIKVTLQEPVIKHPEKYDKTKPIRLNKLNNVEWDLDIGTNETKELTLKYTVEHPINEELDSTVVHISTASTSSEV